MVPYSVLKRSNVFVIRKSPAQKKPDGTIDLWVPVETGDWATDNATGRRCADDLIEQMTAHERPILLGHTVRAMVDKGTYGGVEVGFFHRIAERLISLRTLAVTALGGGSFGGYGALIKLSGHACLKGMLAWCLSSSPCLKPIVTQVAGLF